MAGGRKDPTNIDQPPEGGLEGLACHDTLPAHFPLPPDALAAYQSRRIGHARGFFTVKEFSAMIGRHRQFVSDRCAAGVIHTLPGGKPYRIALSEDDRWNKLPARKIA